MSRLSKLFLKYKVLAEGVEDEETKNILSDLDVDSIQGYYFSKPLLRDEMEEFISNFNSSNV